MREIDGFEGSEESLEVPFVVYSDMSRRVTVREQCNGIVRLTLSSVLEVYDSSIRRSIMSTPAICAAPCPNFT